jgi:hypothetical protein
MEKLKKYSWAIGVVVAVLFTASVAYAAVSGIVIENVENFNYNGSGDVSELGIAQRATKFTHLEVTGETQTTDLTVTDDVAITDDVTIGGDLALTGTLNTLEGYTDLNLTSTVTTTLTVAMSGETFYFGGVSSTAFVLPATSTSAGVFYRFVVDSAMSSTNTIQTSDLGNHIEGALIVAGAVVDCDAEDTLTFVGDGENLGDFVELRSNGTNWFIGASGALTASKLTCSAT